MSDRDALLVEGVVIAEHRGDLYAIEHVAGATRRRVLAKRSGRLVQHFLRLIPGDRVVVELSPYDLSRGRVVRRLRDGESLGDAQR